MDWNTFLQFYIGLWFITFPLSIVFTYFFVIELLDIIFNSSKINNLLKHSDTLNTAQLAAQHDIEKEKQFKLTKSILMELERQINYKRLTEKDIKNIKEYRISYELKDKITAAKRVSDIFKIK